ncbi:helix-turn-helix domain-containing protein [Gracilibacillus salitolerans]|uniref:Helix-turn-helix domain-containing protein n=1 Tax=Gracilibacillus salitolerans TaxID=2663022 RepID=A0A5Q2TII7_9BACI|nr:helix-turn-helix domain-containing protein [Gracilibacillus salitolerans]QGH33931.1 helix-turn-helix domain-containing protein [Gracilibacillus salitolerans]
MDKLFSVKYRLSGNPDHQKLHSHEDFEIFMFHKGVCRYLINNQIYDLLPGDILLMDGLPLHKPNIPEEDEYIRSHIHFIPEVMEPVLHSMKAIELLNVFHHSHHYLIRTNNMQSIQQIEEIFKKMDQVNQSINMLDSEKEWELKFLLGQLLVQINYLFRDTCSQVNKESSSKTEHAEKIASYIQQHFQHKITISEIAYNLCLNKSYVSHVFKEMTGYTIMEYVMACRLKQVKYLLEAEEKKPVQEIAYESGFENISHFSRYFKEKIGIPPREYRKKRLAIYHNASEYKSLNL